MATILQSIEADGNVARVKRVPVTITNGAAAGTFTIPVGAVVTGVINDTPVAIPGTPTTSNLSLGSAAAGAQYVAAVDVKAQGFTALTVLYAMRNAAASAKATVHYTVASSGGTAASQDGEIVLAVQYYIA